MSHTPIPNAGPVAVGTPTPAGPAQETSIVAEAGSSPAEIARTIPLPDDDATPISSPKASIVDIASSIPLPDDAMSPISSPTTSSTATASTPVPTQAATLPMSTPAPTYAIPTVQAPVQTTTLSPTPAAAPASTPAPSKRTRRGGAKHHVQLKNCRSELVAIQTEIDSIQASISAAVIAGQAPEPSMLTQLAALQARKNANLGTSDAVLLGYAAASRAAEERRQRMLANTAAKPPKPPRAPAPASNFAPLPAPARSWASYSPESTSTVAIYTSPRSNVAVPAYVPSQPAHVTCKPATAAPAQPVQAPAWAAVPFKRSAAVKIRAPGSAPVASPTPSYALRVDAMEYKHFATATGYGVVPGWRQYTPAPQLSWQTDPIPRLPSQAYKAPSGNPSQTGSSVSPFPKAAPTVPVASAPPANPAITVTEPKSKATTASKPASKKNGTPAKNKATPADAAAAKPVAAKTTSTKATPAKKTETAAPAAVAPSEKSSKKKNKKKSANDTATPPVSQAAKAPRFSTALQLKYLPLGSASLVIEPARTGCDFDYLFPEALSTSVVRVRLPVPGVEATTRSHVDDLLTEGSAIPRIRVCLPGTPSASSASPAAVPASAKPSAAAASVPSAGTEASGLSKRSRRRKNAKSRADGASEKPTAASGDLVEESDATHYTGNNTVDFVMDCDPPTPRCDGSKVSASPAPAASKAATKKPKSPSQLARAARRSENKRAKAEAEAAAAASSLVLAKALTVSLPESCASTPVLVPCEPAEPVPAMALITALPESAASTPVLVPCKSAEPVPSMALTTSLPESVASTPVLIPRVSAEPVPYMALTVSLPESATSSPVLVPSSSIEPIPAMALTTSLPESAASTPVLVPCSPAEPIPEMALTASLPESAASSPETTATTESEPVPEPSLAIPLPASSASSPVLIPCNSAVVPAMDLTISLSESVASSLEVTTAAEPVPELPLAIPLPESTASSPVLIPCSPIARIPAMALPVSLPESVASSPDIAPTTIEPVPETVEPVPKTTLTVSDSDDAAFSPVVIPRHCMDPVPTSALATPLPETPVPSAVADALVSDESIPTLELDNSPPDSVIVSHPTLPATVPSLVKPAETSPPPAAEFSTKASHKSPALSAVPAPAKSTKLPSLKPLSKLPKTAPSASRTFLIGNKGKQPSSVAQDTKPSETRQRDASIPRPSSVASVRPPMRRSSSVASSQASIRGMSRSPPLPDAAVVRTRTSRSASTCSNTSASRSRAGSVASVRALSQSPAPTSDRISKLKSALPRLTPAKLATGPNSASTTPSTSSAAFLSTLPRSNMRAPAKPKGIPVPKAKEAPAASTSSTAIPKASSSQRPVSPETPFNPYAMYGKQGYDDDYSYGRK